MRLSKEECNNLVNSIGHFRPFSEIFLFGSRADKNKKGGDIDLLIIDEKPLTVDERVRIEMSFWEVFGPQKLDLVSFPKSSDDPFKRIALKNAIRLK